MTLSLLRVAAFVPTTADAEKRSVDLVIATTNPVRRYVGGKDVDEVLDMSPSSVRFTRAANGLPLMIDHSYEIDSQIGVIDNIRIEGDSLVGTATFSAREDVTPIYQDVVDGIIRGVSVGAFIYRVRAEDTEAEVMTMRVVDWEPYEASLVAIPADPRSTTRSTDVVHDDEEKTTEILLSMCAEEDGECDEEEPTTERSVEDESGGSGHDDNTPSKESNMSDTNENAIVAERTRAAEIVSLTRKLDLGDAFSDAQIASGASLDSVRAAALDAVAAKSAAVATSSVRASVSDESIENPAVKRTALEGALSARIAGVSPTGVAAQFAGVGVVGIARELTGLHRASNDQVIERAMAVSSDFPIVLANVANKVLLDTYKVAEPTFVKWSKKVDFNDFRAHSFASLGDFPALAAKAEGADYTESTIGEKGESITATELGRIFHLSRRAMVNDDLGAFSNIATLAATRARLTENSKVYGVLSTNAVLSDSVALFHATHGNLAGTGAAPSVATIAAGRLAMLSQTSVDGLPLNIGPTYLVCGPTTELAALKAVGVIAPAVETNVNPFAGKIEVVVDATITGNEWYLVASPVLAPSVGYGYVAGRGPFLTSRVKFESQSFQFLLGLDFGTGALDYRGIYKNSGAS